MIKFVKQVDGQEQIFESQSFLGVMNTNVKASEAPSKDAPADQGAES
ncbi:hypothetical protein ABEO98_22735 [Brevibacillus parabrevis]